MASKIEAPASYIVASLYRDTETAPHEDAATVDLLKAEDITRVENLDELIQADLTRNHSLFEVAQKNGSIRKVFLITDEDTIKAVVASPKQFLNTTLTVNGHSVNYPARLYINAVVQAWDTRELDSNYSRNAA